MATILESAIAYRRRGFSVIPIRPKDKKPYVAWEPFQKEPAPEATIRLWFESWPMANLAIVSGAVSDLIVVDLDSEEAKTKFKNFLSGYDLSAVPRVRTGRGYHLYFKHPGGNPRNGVKLLDEKIDLRADGGYVVTAPSLHESGKRYAWEVPISGELPNVPADLLKLITSASVNGNGRGDHPRFDSSTVWEGIPEGQRDDMLFRYACQMRGNNAPRDVADRLICEAAARCKPPFAERDALEKVKQAYQRYQPRQPQGAPVKQAEIWPEFLTAKEILQAPKDPTRWIVSECLPAGGASVLVSKPKVGKSTLAADLAISVARGEPWLARVTQQSPVAYVFLDGPLTDIADTFVGLGLRESDPVFIHAGSAPVDAVEWILAAVRDKGARLVIIDVLQKLCRFENINDYSEVTTKMEPLLEAARAGNCHVMTLHHAKKDSRDDLDAAIGSTAIRGLCYTYLFAKRLLNSERRIISSDQRGGKNFSEMGIGFDKLTGRVCIQGTIDEVEIEEAIPLILKQLEGDPEQIEADIRKAIPMRAWIVGKALRQLVVNGEVERTGAGKRGNPWRYSQAASLLAMNERPKGHSDGLPKRGIVKGDLDSSPYLHSLGNGLSGLESKNGADITENKSEVSCPDSRDKLGTSWDKNQFSQGSGLESESWEKVR